ncbi:MAG: 23S rRNA (guanosine(2251)-2'-O)-methyltransferase RlmB [Myxococcota bacterium]
MSKSEMIYGRHPVREQLAARPTAVRRILISEGTSHPSIDELTNEARRAKVRVERLSRRKLESLVGRVSHQGVAAEVEPFGYADLSDLIEVAIRSDRPGLLVVLDQIQDPHNLGAILRSAYALGAHGVIIVKDRATEVTGTVSKASAGAATKIPIARVTNLRNALEQLKKNQIWVYGTAANGSKTLSDIDLTGPVALVIGNEGKGLRRLVAETCDELVRIPMLGELGSLNASVSAGIALYEVVRQRSV